MKLGINNIEEFKVFFDVIYDFADVVELQLFPDRLICSVLDKAHVRFYNVEYMSDFFDLYNVEDVDSVIIFIDDLYKLLKSSNKSDSLLMEIDDDYLICKLTSENGNSRVFEYVLPSEEVESPSIPRFDLKTSFNVDVKDLKQSVKDLGLVGTDICKLILLNDCLKITTTEDSWNKYTHKINLIPDNFVEMISSRYNWIYIDELLKFNKINKVVEFKMGDTFPLFFQFKNNDLGVSVKGLIAPNLGEE